MRTRNIMLAILLTTIVACQAEDNESKQSGAQVVPPTGSEPGVVSGVISNGEQKTAVEAGTQPSIPSTAAKATATEQAIKDAPSSAPLPVKPVEAASQVAPVVQSGGVLDESAVMALAKKSNCLVCHSLEKKMVGPAWRDVGIKYKNDAGAEKRLFDKVAKGGSGAWGAMAMPPQAQVSEEDRRKLVRFILSLK